MTAATSVLPQWDPNDQTVSYSGPSVTAPANGPSSTRAIFGRSYAAEPDVLIEQLAEDAAIAAADTLMLTVPNQLGVEYNAHLLESILTQVAPALGWR